MKNYKIGILGGGQLARMSLFAAKRLGFDVAILEKEKYSPASQLTQDEYVGWVDDKKMLTKFVSDCDIITLENEFIDYQELMFIESLGKKVVPSSHTISLIQDKFLQKQTLSKAKIRVPKFIDVNVGITYEEISAQLGKKFLLKSRKMGYDGYGNYTVKSKKDFFDGLKKLQLRSALIMAEEFVPFEKELAIMVVRTDKEIKTYPVVETIQENHICKIVIAPAEISAKVKKQAEEIAIASIKSIKGKGLFGVELFLTKDEKIFVNEIAPRPHNSGHYTIEGCKISQFENHIRAVLNLPLGSTELVNKYAVMINLLGKGKSATTMKSLNKILNDKEIHLHIYGKEISKLGRKMGHITMVGDELKLIISKLKKAEKEIII